MAVNKGLSRALTRAVDDYDARRKVNKKSRLKVGEIVDTLRDIARKLEKHIKR